MKNHFVDASKSTLFINNDGVKAWLEIAPGIRSNGAPYHCTSDRFALDLAPFESDEAALRSYLASEVRKIAAQFQFEKMSNDLAEALPEGFAL